MNKIDVSNLELTSEEPAVELKKYYQNIKQYENVKEELKPTEKKLNVLQQKLKDIEEEFSKVNLYLTEAELVDFSGVDENIELLKSREKKELSEILYEFEDKKSKIEKQKKIEEAAIENDYKENIKSMEEDLLRLSNLTPVENKALDFEIERHNYSDISDVRIKEYDEKITQEETAAASDIQSLKNEIKIISEKYQPSLRHYQKIIDSIKKKHQTGISECQQILAGEIEKRDIEINSILSEKDQEIEATQNRVNDYQREFRDVKKDFNERIRLAKLQGRPYTQMENSLESRLNDINKKINSEQTKLEKKLNSIDKMAENIAKKYDAAIKKYEFNLENAINIRDNELSEPRGKYQDIKKEQDTQINELKNRIDNRESYKDSVINDLQNKINYGIVNIT